MPVQRDGAAAGVALVALGPEDPCALLVEHAGTDQLVNRTTGGVHRVQREPRLRPLFAAGQFIGHVLLDPRIANIHHPGGERAIIVDQLLCTPKTSMSAHLF